MKLTRILLADDYPLIRSGIRATLASEPDFQVAGEASDGLEMQQICQQVQPELLLMDVSMPGPTARANVQFLLQHFPELKILALFEKEDQENLFPLLELGVDGHIYKDEAPDVLVRALRAIVQGDHWISRRAIALLIKRSGPTSPSEPKAREASAPLSCRELEILQLLGKGLSNEQIALQLRIAERTVRHHIEKILDKLDAPNRTRAAMIAIQNGWIAA